MKKYHFKLAMGVVFVLFITIAPWNVSGEPNAQPDESSLFRFVRTVQITPDDHFQGGGFARINYVPATDRLVVTFGAQFDQPLGGCMNAGHAYKEYTWDMQETGQFGVFSCEVADLGSVMVENTYYDVSMHAIPGEGVGWRIVQYDAVSWEALVDLFFPLGLPYEKDNDPTVAYINGQLDISGQYDVDGPPPPLEVGAATHHHFFSTDLELLDERILADEPHVCGSSMIVVDDITYFITADAFMGDVIVMQYDRDWNYLGMHELIEQAHWSTGIFFDGERFYLAYMDTSQRSMPGFLPVSLNVHLAAFDRDWTLVEDMAVTNYTFADHRQPGRPWVILHENRLYVSYDLDTIDPVTHEEQRQGQAIVSVYELAQDAPLRNG